MNRLTNHINILLVCCNIVGIGSYIYMRIVNSHKYEYLLIIFIFSLPDLTKYPHLIRIHFCLIALLTVASTFVTQLTIDLLINSITLAYSLNLGYTLVNLSKGKIKITFYESLLNLSLSIAVIFSVFTDYLQIYKVTGKIIILITTIPNLYLSNNEDKARQEKNIDESQHHLGDKQRQWQNVEIGNKMIYYLNPMMGHTWFYALGYCLGIYINLFQIIILSKYVKYMIVALLILIETLTYNYIIKMICLFLRSIFIFHFEPNSKSYESYYIFIYLILCKVIEQDIINIYLIIGYILIAITIWRQEYNIDYTQIINSNKNIHQTQVQIMERHEIQMKPINMTTQKELQQNLLDKSNYSRIGNSY